MKTSAVTAETTTPVTLLDPAQIGVGDNVRFSLKETRIESLAADILNVGEIHTPLRVYKLRTPDDEGNQYRVKFGHYRHAAALHLNQTANVGVMCPCIIEDEPAEASPADLVRYQLSENLERENMTPMDKAIAIKRLQDAGVPRMEMRKIFTTPGGRKGLKNQPASNSFLNIHLSFLDLPKAIQERIHDGRITLTGAMELVDKPADKRAELLESIEADRLAAIDKEEKQEEKLLNEQKRITEAQEAEATAKKEAEAKLAEAEKIAAELQEKQKLGLDLYRQSKEAKLKPEDRKKAQESFKANEADAQALQKKLDTTTKEVTKLQTAAEKAAETAKKRLADLEAKRKAKLAKKPITKEDVKQAAAKRSDIPPPTVALKLPELKGAFAEMEKSSYPKVKAIGRLLRLMAHGTHTTKQTIQLMARDVTAELKEKGTK